MLENMRDIAPIQSILLVGGGADAFRKAVKAVTACTLKTGLS